MVYACVKSITLDSTSLGFKTSEYVLLSNLQNKLFRISIYDKIIGSYIFPQVALIGSLVFLFLIALQWSSTRMFDHKVSNMQKIIYS